MRLVILAAVAISLVFTACATPKRCKKGDVSCLEKQCKGEVRKACVQLGELSIKGGEFAKAQGFYARACDLKDAGACFAVAHSYLRELGREDYDKARGFFQKACELDNADGCSNAGALHYNGRGVKQDYGVARGFFERACELGGAEGCRHLAMVYEDGRSGVKQDLQKANKYYKKSCDLNQTGYGKGCSALALAYENGYGVRQSFVSARDYYGKACDLGDQKGCDAYRRLNWAWR